MAKKQQADDDAMMVLARGLSTLAASMRFSLGEASDVERCFSEIVRAVEATRDIAAKIESLESEIAQLKRLRVAS